MSEIQTTNWSETANNNNATPPNGAPEGMAPSAVNDWGREVMAALRRWFGRTHGIDESEALIASAGTSTAITVTYSNAPASLFTGLEVGFKVTTTCGNAPTLNVNSLGAKNIQKLVDSTYANLVAGDIVSGQHVKLKYDGTLDKFVLLQPINTMGKRKRWVPVGDMIPAATSGAAAGSFVGSSNAQNISTLDFDQTTNESAFFNLSMSSSWDGGTVTFRPVWTAASGTGDVVWLLDGTAYSDDDPLDAAFGSPSSSTDTLLATNDLHRGPESNTITIAGTPQANDLVNFRVRRNASTGSDTLNADAKLIGIELYYTVNGGTDSAT